MTNPTPTEAARRRRWINFGELIALAALIISALGLWHSWKDDGSARPAPTTVVEAKRTIPLVLRGQVADEGKALLLAPVEASHALDSLTLTANGKSIAAASDGRLTAADIESLLGNPKQKKDGALIVAATVRYIEAGADKTAKGRYRIAYQWTGGGLFSGRDVRLTAFTRA